MLSGLPDKLVPMLMAIEHSGMNISADVMKTKLMDMNADSEIATFEGVFIIKRTYQFSNKEKTNGVVKRTQMLPANINYTSYNT